MVVFYAIWSRTSDLEGANVKVKVSECQCVCNSLAHGAILHHGREVVPAGTVVHGVPCFGCCCASQPEVVIGKWTAEGSEYVLLCDNFMPAFTLFVDGLEAGTQETPQQWFAEKYRSRIRQAIIWAVLFVACAVAAPYLMFVADDPPAASFGTVPMTPISFILMVTLGSSGMKGSAFVKNRLRYMSLDAAGDVETGDTDRSGLEVALQPAYIVPE
eukprot:TRINITY_DN2956_c0_g3_i1.p1 TRINITY_DN2956_c0_g3~~TRINITY_DN2956_c0_g3_i1.p1  ORF type:complete len:215 (+),score=47.18 TRINITY_DN2956_c0_g3_i1:59-703(+)